MEDSKLGELDKLKDKNLEELQAEFERIFGRKTDSTNDTFLRRKIAYRIQEMELGGLSKKAKMRLDELIEKYDPVNNKALRPKVTTGGKELKTLPSMRDKPEAVGHKTSKWAPFFVTNCASGNRDGGHMAA